MSDAPREQRPSQSRGEQLEETSRQADAYSNRTFEEQVPRLIRQNALFGDALRRAMFGHLEGLPIKEE